MSAVYDLYQLGDSWLHRLDPRAKLAFVGCGALLWLLFDNLWLMAAAVVLLQTMLLSAGISRRRLRWVWSLTLPTMALIAVLWVVFYPGEGTLLFEVWFLRVTWTNLAQGLAVALRIGALALTFFVLLLTTDQSALVHGLTALGLPYPWGLTLGMALRYLPTMAGNLRMVTEAQQARALNLNIGNPLKRARAYVPIAVATIITALRTAENLSRALESRALDLSSRRRTYLHPLHFRASDLAFCLTLALVTAGLLWFRFGLGMGTHPLRLFP
ncbi:MAG: energy-coupling factor transporter transmembrane component T family protein [Anaerolineae bacterium]